MATNNLQFSIFIGSLSSMFDALKFETLIENCKIDN